MQHKIALIVGRFQPFHKGHLFLIKKALANADKIIIGIGSTNITDDNNPIDFETRRKVIKAVFYKEGIKNKLIKIVPLDDFFDDKKWLGNVKKQVGEFDIALGNNEWTNKILGKAGFKVLKVDYYKRGIYEGWRIRKLIREVKKWQNRVPKYLIKAISNFEFRISNFQHVVLGGTFDHFHKGHRALLDKAIAVGKNLTIGVAEGALLDKKFLKNSIESFITRKNNVKKYIAMTTKTKIIAFSDIYGPTLTEKDIDAIVVSRETFPNALKINELRKENDLKPLMIVIIEDVLAEDGKLISSERIRAGEIDREGKKYQISNIKNQKEIKMPEALRPILQKPLGQVYKTTQQLVGAIRESPFFRSPKKQTMIIAVGDIIVDSLLKEGVDPDVKIIDFKSRRKPIKRDTLIKDSLYKDCLYLNKPGTINLKTAEVLRQMIRSKIRHPRGVQTQSWLVVDGEEDLLALPAILFAPLNSLILYGHWQHGIIAVEVDEEIKDKVRKIIKKFN